MKRKIVGIFVMTLLIATVLPVLGTGNNNITEEPKTQPLKVDNEGDGDYITIQEAIDAADAGTEIWVYSGTYNEKLNIDETKTSIALIGKDEELGSGTDTGPPIIDGGGIDQCVCNHADYVILKGFTIISRMYDGVVMYDAGFCTISKNTITDCLSGIHILSTSHDNMISENIISSNSWHGININNCDHNTIRGNTITDCMNGGIRLVGRWNTVLDNSISLNSNGGIFIYGTGNLIHRNTIEGNTDYGIYCQFIESVDTIYNNKFINNGPPQACDEGENIWNISKTSGTNIIGGSWLGGNYWDDYTGSDTDADGFGDTPYDFSVFKQDMLPLVPVYIDIEIIIPTLFPRFPLWEGYSRDVQAKIKNTGATDYSNVVWSIDLEPRGVLGLPYHEDGVILELPAGGETIIKTSRLLGFGRSTLTILVGEKKEVREVFRILRVVIYRS